MGGCQPWWHILVISELGGLRQEEPQVPGQPQVHSETLSKQNKASNKKKKKEEPLHVTPGNQVQTITAPDKQGRWFPNLFSFCFPPLDLAQSVPHTTH